VAIQDRIDAQILTALQAGGRTTMAEIGSQVGLSASAVTRRVERLEAEGVIRGYMALIAPAAVGLTVTAFVTVTLTRQAEVLIEAFEKAVVEFPEVAEVHLMAGTTDYLLRVITADLASYERFLKRRLTRVPGVAHVQTAFSLSNLKLRPSLDLSHLEGGPGAAPPAS
jgi:DNA-binding Lrp family transcriptional regulator